MAAIQISVDLRGSASRRIQVAIEFDADPVGVTEVFFPVWTPGSYLIREYARNLSGLRASSSDHGDGATIEQTAKNRWRVHGSGRLTLRYSIHAHELTVRTADADADHAFWNGACVYLWPVGRGAEPATIHVRCPKGWDLATQLPCERQADGFVLQAANLDAAIDAPCLAAELQRIPFDVLGVPHEFVVWGMGALPVPDSLVQDTRRVIETSAQIFGGSLPYPRYAFLSLHTDQGGGGLEHTESSTLLAPRTTFSSRKSYRGFLGLVAHEHFHAWNVKRMRPASLWNLDYEHENHTELLWVAEGFTAYYDELLCLRAGVHDAGSYLRSITTNINGLHANPGRFVLSLSRSSYDAWTRLYRADEDTRNTSQNYYSNGALAALVLDLTIRDASSGARSLDDAMGKLWESTWEQGRGYTREDVDRCLSEAAGIDLGPAIADLVDGPFDPELAELLGKFGIQWAASAEPKSYLGVTFRKSTTTLTNVVAGGPADGAGLCPGDELLAINNLRAGADDWESLLDAATSPGTPVPVLVARRGVVLTCTVTPGVAPSPVELSLAATPTAEAAHLRRGWIGA